MDVCIFATITLVDITALAKSDIAWPMTTGRALVSTQLLIVDRKLYVAQSC